MVTSSTIHRLFHAIDQVEKRSRSPRPFKVVRVRRGYHEEPDVARDRHYAAHPDDRNADVVIFEFYDDNEGMAGESR
jgi:hypothetical protein